MFNTELAIDLLPDLLKGALVTIQLMVPVAIIGLALSVFVALGRISASRWLSWPCEMFTVIFRGAPMLLVLYLVYNGLAQVSLVRDTFLWSFFREPFNCALVALSINHAAFLSEIWRGGILAVPKGMGEASDSLRLGSWTRMTRVILPLAFRLGFSSYRNETVMFVKATSVVGAITVFDLLAFANDAVQLRFDPFTPFIMAGVVYWVMVQALQFAFKRLERRLYQHVVI